MKGPPRGGEKDHEDEDENQQEEEEEQEEEQEQEHEDEDGEDHPVTNENHHRLTHHDAKKITSPDSLGSVPKRGQWETTENVTLQKRPITIVISLSLEESRCVLRVSRHTHFAHSLSGPVVGSSGAAQLEVRAD